jgi:hypothetical protein
MNYLKIDASLLYIAIQYFNSVASPKNEYARCTASNKSVRTASLVDCALVCVMLGAVRCVASKVLWCKVYTAV